MSVVARDTWPSVALGVVATGLILVAPVVLVGHETRVDPAAPNPVATSATAALGVILRSNAQTLLHGTLMTTFRATTRTVSRRGVRRGMQILAATFLPRRTEPAAPQDPRLSLLVGAAVVAASFATVLVSTGATLGHTGALAAAACVPLVVHFLIMRAAAAREGVAFTYSTPVDGILLQAYFSAAGSFLPLASDAGLDGPADARGRVAAVGLTVLWSCALVFFGLGRAGVPLASDLGSLFMVYAFVFSFPLRPLDGSDLYAWSPCAWGCAFFAGLLVFATCLPGSWLAVL